jgi:hypothetical protein
VRETAAAVLAGAGYRRAARRLAAEIATLPHPRPVVPLLGGLRPGEFRNS